MDSVAPRQEWQTRVGVVHLGAHGMGPCDVREQSACLCVYKISTVVDKHAHETERSLSAPCWHARLSQDLVVLQAGGGGVEGLPRPMPRDLSGDVVQVARGF